MEEALYATEIADVAAWARARSRRLEADVADPKDERDDDSRIDDGAGGEEADRCLESPKDRCPKPMLILRESSPPTSRRFETDAERGKWALLGVQARFQNDNA